MKLTSHSSWLAIAVVAYAPAAWAQDAPPADQLPDVEVQQQQAPAAQQPKPAAAKPKPKPKPQPQQQAAPAPQPAAEPAPQAPAEDFADAPPPQEKRNSETGRLISNSPNANPVTPATGIAPADLQNYTGAATRLDAKSLEEQQPLTTHDALLKVPGVVTVTDDGAARHSGIGIRGAPFRRSRKVLVLEDGQAINFNTYLDPSTHYTPPLDRIEDIEVIRGTIISHGPLNNHGVVNFRNLDPFGANETVIRGAIGKTSGSDRDWNNERHVHTRQSVDNAGIVLSYTGADTGGAWNTEDLGYNDFYGALGVRLENHEFIASGGYFRQRDVYDEANFQGSYADFFSFGRDKRAGADAGFFESGAGAGYDFASYNADYWHGQLTHNWFITSDVTLSTKIFAGEHDRARFFPRSGFDGTGVGHMRGRDRLYENVGIDSRIEFANVNLISGIKQDVQVGVHYEEQKLLDQNTRGATGEFLDFDNRGNPFHPSSGRVQAYEADAFSAFIQTSIYATPDLTITPGVRFENYDVTRNTIFLNSYDDPADLAVASGSSSHTHVLPGIGIAWEALNRTTLYGGYHRGVTPSVVRGEAFPLGDEVGDNFQIGVRSSAVKGLTFDLAYFHSSIEDFQIKSPFTDPVTGQNVFGAVDEVRINGFEIFTRAESKPFTGGPWNVFGEATYTYTDGEIADSDDPLEIGQAIPEVPRHFAHLTLGLAHDIGWDASVSYTYRGDFFTDTLGSRDLVFDDGEVVGGVVPDVWLLSARSNLKVSDQLSLYVTGTNLTNEFYASDLSDGIKPGQGRTVMGGFKLKFD